MLSLLYSTNECITQLFNLTLNSLFLLVSFTFENLEHFNFDLCNYVVYFGKIKTYIKINFKKQKLMNVCSDLKIDIYLCMLIIKKSQGN